MTQICNILQDITLERIFKIINIELISNEELATKYRYKRLYKDFYLFIKS